MTTAPAFPLWFSRVRAGDPAAAAELVRAFTPAVQGVVRARLARLRLTRLIDPQDVCQSVLASFFTTAIDRRPQVHSADQLTALLVAIARNKVRDEVRRHMAGRRDHRLVAPGRDDQLLDRVRDRRPSPSTVVAWRELCDRALQHLSAEERAVLEDRLAGRDWTAIAADRGVAPDVLRQQLNRAIRRLRRLYPARPAAGPAG